MSIANSGVRGRSYDALYSYYSGRYEPERATGVWSKGGIYTETTRLQMLGQKPLNKTEPDFWNLRRRDTRNALTDLSLFIDTGSRNQARFYSMVSETIE